MPVTNPYAERGVGPRFMQRAKPRAATPEQEASGIRRSLLAEGSATRQQGVDALRMFDPEEYLGADALQAIFEEAGATSFIPQLRNLQARNARRGVRGPLAGATEGDLASAFQRNLLATTARFGAQRGQMAFNRGSQLAEIGGFDRAQGISLLGTEMELQLAREEAKRQEKAGWRKFAGGLIGGAGGFLIGGPAGAAAGAQIGSSI